ncbi:MAG: glycine cleavage system aminomethyltransferase GcvT [Clostridia bacterium]|nr:glycine cleavage system aminomethyltransferase GcvT [Clostridia bacterium]MBN2882094.1 glycine cleavage system aminomethyltransferase GcvT [Clostridia bacterium]
MKKTPVYSTHVELRARMIDFGGWMMPVQYSGILEEHNKVRESAGLFDVSHMGEILLQGQDALGFADYLVTNDLCEMKYGDVVYSPMCYENGGCVDDILVYCMGDEKIMLVVNASNIEKDFDWIDSNTNGFNVTVNNVSDSFSQLAVQGPKAQQVLQRLTSTELDEIGFFKFRENVLIDNTSALVSRTGYTGEDGFEIYIEATAGEKLFRLILDEGGSDILPCGLGARDTLRMESCLPLYGHELTPDITPVQAGLGYFIKLTDKPFIGKAAIKREMQEKPRKRVAGFEMMDRGIARNGYKVYDRDKKEIGFVTSGSFCPTLSKNMGLALIDAGHAGSGNTIFIEVRKNLIEANTVKKPFYKKKYKK